MPDVVTVETEEIAVIQPHLHGHFAEHLGRCIYGGLWVGDGPPDATTNGIRSDTIALLAELGVPILRWPGGCFADEYHWRDGIGPRDDRPRRRNAHWTQGRANVPEESNAFGTHEFLELCDELDADPYLAANVGTGSPDEVSDWVEYCNYDGDTTLTARRRENGREESWDVRYWGVGNENWGCGGNYDPGDYAREYRRFATYLRSLRSPMGIDLELVACGHFAGDWNDVFLETLGSAVDMVDHLSVHRYYSAGSATEFSDAEYFELFADSLRLLQDIDEAAETIRQHAPPDSIGIAVDEWGVWHPVAESDNGLEQPNTVRDAVSAAGILDGFHNRADVVSMANLAQTVNVLQCLVQTDGEDAWPTPTYHVFELYAPHRNGTALDVTIDTDDYTEADGPDVPLVTASASETDGHGYVTVSNRDLSQRTIELSTRRWPTGVESAKILFGDDSPDTASMSEQSAAFDLEELSVSTGADSLEVQLPGASVAGIRFAS